jgi:hypothetical protein
MPRDPQSLLWAMTATNTLQEVKEEVCAIEPILAIKPRPNQQKMTQRNISPHINGNRQDMLWGFLVS